MNEPCEKNALFQDFLRSLAHQQASFPAVFSTRGERVYDDGSASPANRAVAMQRIRDYSTPAHFPSI